MRAMVFFLASVASIALGLCFRPEAGSSQDVSQESYAGWIEEIHAPAYLRHAATSKPILLDPRRDRFRKLYAGESFRCGPKGSLKLQIYGKMIGIAETSNWFPVPQVPSRAPDLKQRALESYGRLGGRERGGFSVIFSPANESSVRAKDFVIRWVPRVSVEKISLTIGADTGEELWRQNGVDGRSGQLFSETARQAVKKYRDSGAQGQLVLFFAEPGGSESRVVFWPLPVAAEYSLEQELNIWDRETAGLMRHICRAFSFARRSMFSEVADEYDVALEMDPESQDLLLTAIEAHRRTGNSLRVIELTRRLSKRPPD